MSPEYVVTKNLKTGKSEIQVNLLPGEISQELREETIIAYIAEDNLKYKDGPFKAKKTLLRVLPPEIVNPFVQAVIEGKEDTFVAFKKTENGEYKIVDTNLPVVNNRSGQFDKNSDF